MTETQTAEAIIKKYLTIIGSNCEHDSYCKSKDCKFIGQHHCRVEIKTAKQCAKYEVQAIIDNTELYVNFLRLQYNDFDFSTLEFWQGVLEEIK